MMRVLTFSALYPNAAQPVHGIFVENRIRHLAESGEAAVQVVAPVPWFPVDAPMFGRYAAYARAPRQEIRRGLTVHHPRFPVIPAVGMTLAPLLMYLAVKPHVARLIRETGGFDVLDAHYFYPDGVAAALLARDFGLPLVVTGRGTDLIVIPRFALPRRQLLWAISRAAAMITVSQDLRQRLIDLGTAPERVRVLRNGVDLKMFRPLDHTAARARLGLLGPALICVGGLIPRKGQELAIGALPELPGVTLLIVGEGPDRAKLEAQARSLGVMGRVRFLGRVLHDELPRYYAAADIMLLPSSAEGWANVLLESMACGTPVVATRVGSADELVTDPAAGVLMTERSVAALVAGVRQLIVAPPDRAATRRHAEKFDWQATTDGQLALFREVIAGFRPAARTAPGTAAS